MTPTLCICEAADRDAINSIIGDATGWNMAFSSGAAWVPAVPPPDFNTPITNYIMEYLPCPDDQSAALVQMAAGVLPALAEGYAWGENGLIAEIDAQALFVDNKFKTVVFSGLTDEEVYTAIQGDGTPENQGVLRGTLGLVPLPVDI